MEGEVNFVTWLGLGMLLLALGFVVGYVCGYETRVNRHDE